MIIATIELGVYRRHILKKQYRKRKSTVKNTINKLIKNTFRDY